MRRDVHAREAWLEQRIRTATYDGTLNGDDSAHDMRMLNSIRHQESNMRDSSGQISGQDEARLQERLDRLSASLRLSLNGAGF